METTTSDRSSRRARLLELATLFLRLGSTAFGGPAAHIAMMEEEVVRRRRWMTREAFLDLLAATHLIPGPNSTEMAIHIGRLRAGAPGLVVAGACFIVPAMLMVMGIGWAYVEYRSLPQVEGLLYGIKPVIVAVVTQALAGLARSAARSLQLGAIGLAALLATFLGVDELLVLLVAGLVSLAWRQGTSLTTRGRAALPWLPFGAATASVAVVGAGAASVPFSAGTLFLFFLKVGSVLFGSGYVLLAFLRADLVERWGWLTGKQLLDAIAVGQLTPGPVFTTATFIGYVLGGPQSALLATLGIFLPAFVFVALSAPLIPRLRRSPSAGAFLDGVVVASLALMAAVSWNLARDAIVDGATGLIAFVSLLALLRFRLNSAWLVLAGGAIGVFRWLLVGPGA
ncbi:MAG: chromate efflux transporter [Deltaproteobacteria bacterium]|nr:chromate efflux transporter [Deltaproteobacteria bacterium]